MRNLRDQEAYNDLRREELRRDIQVSRENESASNGLLTGIVLASLVALGLGAYALMANRQAENPAPRNNTIIERTREVVPVPQPQAPEVKPPDVQINVPNPVPAPEAPTNNSAPTQPAPDSAPSNNSAPANP